MMRLWKITFVLLALFGLPAVATAGPIEFNLTTSNLTTFDYGLTTSTVPNLVLVPTRPPVTSTFDSASGQPTALDVVVYEPRLLPTPGARDLHADGTTHWNFEQYFSFNVTLTDLASGQSDTFSVGGRAHVYNLYSSQNGWTGDTAFWFLDTHRTTLGGNDYTVWGTNLYNGGPVTLDVWVGPNPPVHLTPEPGTLALALLGFVPLGVRGVRRMKSHSRSA